MEWIWADSIYLNPHTYFFHYCKASHIIIPKEWEENNNGFKCFECKRVSKRPAEEF